MQLFRLLGVFLGGSRDKRVKLHTNYVLFRPPAVKGQRSPFHNDRKSSALYYYTPNEADNNIIAINKKIVRSQLKIWDVSAHYLLCVDEEQGWSKSCPAEEALDGESIALRVQVTLSGWRNHFRQCANRDLHD